jgi:thiamine biosynthesis protein ThiS
VTITLNGEPFEVAGPLTVADLLTRLDIDSRRVAVEHNLSVVRRALFGTTETRPAGAWLAFPYDFDAKSLIVRGALICIQHPAKRRLVCGTPRAASDEGRG